MEDQIKATIASAESHVSAAYDKLEEMGATMPTHKNIQNLKDTIYTLPLSVNKVTVTFDAGEGEPSPAAQELYPGQSVSEPSTPTKEGCVFLGWYKSVAPPYDPENPTLAGLKSVINSGDLSLIQIGTEIPDAWDGNDNPWVIGTIQNITTATGEVKNAIGLIRKYVQPTSVAWVGSAGWKTSSIYTYLQNEYKSKCSQQILDVITECQIPNFYSQQTPEYQNTNCWFFLNSGYEMNVYPLEDNTTAKEGTPWQIWQQRTGSSTPSKYPSNLAQSDLDGAKTAYWTRSFHWGNYQPLEVLANGVMTNDAGINLRGVLPCCYIVAD